MRSKILISTTLVTTVLAAGLIGAKLGSNSLKTAPATNHRTSSAKQVNNPPASSPATKHSAVASTSSPWSANKSQQLAKFMLNWASQMGQHYESYYPGHDFNLYGVIFPTPLRNGTMNLHPAVDDHAIDLQWSDDGTGNHDYNLVAVYGGNASSNDRYPVLTMYLFTLHNGKPEVLVTQQNQGNPEGYLYFKPTDNQALASGFASIVNHN